MDTLCKLLLYFDKRSYLHQMKSTCENFLGNLTEKIICKFPPLRFELEIDVIDLLDCFPDLADLLLKEPLKWQIACNDILFICMQSIENEYKENIKKSQVAVTLRLKCVSSLIVKTNPKDYKGLVIFDGLLLSTSKPESYVYHSVWSCLEECEGNEVILPYIPKAPPKCYLCKTVLFENSGMRQCGEQIIATFVLKDGLLTKTLNIVDDLISKLQLGSRYLIHAVVLKKLTAVWGLEEVTLLATPHTSPIPNDIQNLYNACKGVSWKFVYCLASGIGVNICPLNCFMHLKISLLLSLVSVRAHLITGSRILHVLAAGYDTRYVTEIMQEALRLTDSFVYLSTSNCDASTALVASSSGICVMPFPLHLYHQKLILKVLSAVESGEIFVDKSNAKLNCAIWAQGMDYKKMTLHNAASVFGTACRGDFNEHTDELANFVLERATDLSEISKEDQALKDLMVFIDLVAGIEVLLDKTAETLLKEYFLAARRERPGGATLGSMGALVAICINTARLCRRNVANTDDAVFAIWLHISGGPEPRFAPDEYLQTPGDVTTLKNIIIKFKNWLQEFTGTLNL
ncbi:hypothetical protein K1T71_008431 [Dendrolimus kikuchii]|uniref:Uncharacterized protein n=1 Tax=Dendrolimus kikuchii TaxID=765133 RepID=A0ACC1CYQ5_9NEOP|nr:hypothetical protein K1T71_008431 [Dendrolimus kikuchii]